MIFRKLHIGLLLVILFWIGESNAQCLNDNISAGNLSPTGAGYSQSVIIQGGYHVVVNVCAGATYIFSTCGDTSFDSQITVYNQGSGAQLAYNDDACDLQSSIIWSSNFTGPINVVVDEFYCSGSVSFINLNIQQTTACSSGVPANDLCPDTTPIACGQTLSGSTLLAASDTYPLACGFGSAPGVWFTFTGNGQLNTISLCGSSYDTQLSVFTGSCGTLTCIDSDDDFCGSQSQITFTSVAGVLYRVLVFGYSSSSGNFTLNLICNSSTGPNQNCSTALPICNDTQFGGNSAGAGSIIDLNSSNQGCLSIEHQSSWYVFQPTTTGTISFTINPIPAVDYDFAIWGPMSQYSCPVNAPPLRCSYSALSSPTGLGSGAIDLSEGAGGNAWVAPITIAPADVNGIYIMLLDNFVASSTPFIFDWNLGSVVLNCNIQLPVELTSFTGQSTSIGNQLLWTTKSELNNDRFEVERSKDALQYVTIGSVPGNGTSSTIHNYNFIDSKSFFGVDYYRLKQIDYNGQFEYSDVIVLENSSIGQITPNPTDQLFRITLGDEIAAFGGKLNITDMQGRNIKNIDLSQGNSGLMEVSVDDIKPGVYQVSLHNKTGLIISSGRLMVE